MERVPAIAPLSPPETGASSISMSFWARVVARRRVVEAAMLLMSMTKLPALAPCMRPLSPKMICSTSGVSETIVIIMSVCSATALGEVQAVAPACVNGCVISGRRACTQSAWPAWRRLRAIGRPMMPRPIKPIFSVIFFPLVIDHVS